MSRKGIYVEGSTWLQDNGKVLTVISRVKGSLILVKFEDSPPFEVYSEYIKKGSVKDLNEPTVYGVGCFGYGEFVAKAGNKNHTLNMKSGEVW